MQHTDDSARSALETVYYADDSASSSQEIQWMDQLIVPDYSFETVIDGGHIVSDSQPPSRNPDRPLNDPLLTTAMSAVDVSELQDVHTLPVVSGLNVQEAIRAQPDEFVSTSMLRCSCGSTVKHSRTMSTQGTQTDISKLPTLQYKVVRLGDPNVVKKDHHYYELTPQKEKPDTVQLPQPSLPQPGTRQMKKTHPLTSLGKGKVQSKLRVTPPTQQISKAAKQDPPTSSPTTEPQSKSSKQDPTTIPKCKQQSSPAKMPSSKRRRSSVVIAGAVKLSDSSDPLSFSDRSSDPDYIATEGESEEDIKHSKSKEQLAAEGIASVHDRKFLIFEKQLRQLLGLVKCPVCNFSLALPSEDADIGKVIGTALEVCLQCTNKAKPHRFNWASQPRIGRGREEMYAGNLLVSASILFSGGNFAKLSHFANILKCPFISKATFYRHQADYLCPAVHDAWASQQAEIFHQIRVRGTLKVSGDGRCDSPGYSAKFCTYSIMDMETDLIVDTETVEVTEVKSSNAMEQEACRRILDRCEAELPLDVFCTDRHMGIQKMMRVQYDNIKHQYDVWHLAKSVSKRLIQKGKKKEAAELLPWVPSIKTQLWWAASTCNGDTTDLIEKWQSVKYHTTNEHEWNTGQRYTKCAHGDLEPEVEKSVKWIEVQSPAHEALNKVLEDKRLLDGIKKLNLFCHTGKLENFNGSLTKYAPKRISFTHQGMVARTRLAALDHNYNVGRKQAVITKATTNTGEVGEARYNVSYSKATGKYSARPVYQEKDYEFLNDIMIDVVTRKCEQRKKDTQAYTAPKTTRPSIAPKDTPRPPKEELIQQHQSRFGEEHSSDG